MNTPDVDYAVGRMVTFANLVYAVFVLGSLHTKEKFRASEKQVGKNLSKEVKVFMQITDTIADLLTRIRNAISAKHETVRKSLQSCGFSDTYCTV